MREILFRGKRLGDGTWLEGNLRVEHYPKFEDMPERWRCSIYVPDVGKPWSCSIFDVDPKTVGQYTGLKDKTGCLIFEGDIIRTSEYGVDNGKGVNFSGKDKFVIRYDDGSYFLENHLRRFYLRSDSGAEVIGNIHDNPELLGGAE